MRFSRYRLGPQPASMTVLLLASLMIGRGFAQSTSSDSNQNTNTNTNTAAATTAPTAASGTTAATAGNTGSSDGNLPALSTSTTSTEDLPSLSTSSASLPSLPAASDGAAATTYSIPVASVPPTANAPYMQQSNLPEGTVFIAVGGALGLIGLSVLAWRALVAWSINRSVRRAALRHAQLEAKTIPHSRQKQRRSSHHHRGSAMSMEKLGPNHRQSNISSKVPSSQSGLFFSPTAGAGIHTQANRGSSYLPAGYYAAGSAAPGGTHSRTHTASPPSSPTLPPSRGQEVSYQRMSNWGDSNSSLNLNHPPQGRAPSAYLEDLFESHSPASRG